MINEKSIEAAVKAHEDESSRLCEVVGGGESFRQHCTRQLVAAVIHAIHDNAWLDISAAPDDDFIIAYDGKRVRYGLWKNGELWDELGNDWNGFTHWMPLPQPPQEGK